MAHQNNGIRNTLFLVSLFCFGSAQANLGFDVRIQNNGSAQVPVKATAMDKSKYAQSDAVSLPLNLEFRGGCDNGKIKSFQLILGNQHYPINFTAGNKHISGNKGKAWATHSVNFPLSANNPDLIAACNSRIDQGLAQGHSLENILAANFFVNDVDVGIGLKYQATCGTTFDNVYTSPAEDFLDVKAFCRATGYQQPLVFNNIQFVVDKTVTMGGACRVDLKGAFSTNKNMQTIRFRYEHIDKNLNRKLSNIYQVTTNNTGYVNFAHSFPVDNGPGKETGKLRIIGVSDNFQSPQKQYSMTCNEGMSNTFQQKTPTVNPRLPGEVDGIQILPDHTGGGGAPKDLKGKQ